MGDGQEILEEFPKKIKHDGKYIVLGKKEEKEEKEEKHTTIVQTLCWGCGALIEDVIRGEDGWLFCPCGTGIMKVIT